MSLKHFKELVILVTDIRLTGELGIYETDEKMKDDVGWTIYAWQWK